MARRRGNGRALPFRRSSVLARPRYLRACLALPVAFARPHAPRRRAARAMAERSGRRRHRTRSDRKRSRSFARRSIFAKRSQPPAARRAISTPSHSAAGHRPLQRRRASGFEPPPLSWPPPSSPAVVWWARGGPLAPLLIAIVLKMILTRPSRARVARIVRGVERPLAAARRPRRHARCSSNSRRFAARVLDGDPRRGC